MLCMLDIVVFGVIYCYNLFILFWRYIVYYMICKCKLFFINIFVYFMIIIFDVIIEFLEKNYMNL